MIITGLENNYYLSGNDIWLMVNGFAQIPVRLEVQILNNTTGAVLPPLKLYSPTGIYKFNVSLAVRALQPDPNHIAINTMQSYSVTFTAFFQLAEPAIDPETLTITRDFIRGGVSRAGSQDWMLSTGADLVVGKWGIWDGIELPSLPIRIQGSSLVNFIPSGEILHQMGGKAAGCNYTILKFLNSLGGYQFYVFEFTERKIKGKAKGSVSRIAHRLKDNRLRSIGIDHSEELILKSDTPEIMQPVILDLVRSNDVLIYDPTGTDVAGRWHRVELTGTNDAKLNTRDRIYQNELSYSIPNYFNRDL